MTNPLWRFVRYCTPSGWKYFYCLWKIDEFSYSVIRNYRKQIEEKTARGEPSEASGDLLSLYISKNSLKNEVSRLKKDIKCSLSQAILSVTVLVICRQIKTPSSSRRTET